MQDAVSSACCVWVVWQIHMVAVSHAGTVTCDEFLEVVLKRVRCASFVRFEVFAQP
jgi:hypothetical protein